jgi:hypothetical protein
MPEDQPSAFLVIKEPPFPASYNRETYVARVLEEMRPYYSYADYKSQTRLLIRRLPASAEELNGLITQDFPEADLDKTKLQSFDDTDGGKGLRVTIYWARTIEAEADTIEEARAILQTRIPDGFRIKLERVISEPKQTSVTGRGATEGEALADARAQIPSGARVTFTRTLRQPARRKISIAAYGDAEAKAKANRETESDAGLIVESVEFASPGRKGVLGIGRKPNSYECTVFQQATVGIGYSEGKANLLGVLAEATVPEESREDLNSQLIEASNLDEVKLLLTKGADVNAKDSEGKTPLMNAAYYGKKEIAKFLLENGANVNARYVDGCTALIWAAGEGEAEVLEILLKHGADVHAAERNGYTALMIAERMKRGNTAGILANWERRHRK